MRRLSLPFRLRGRDGRVEVEYGANEDPERWGYGLLGLGHPAEKARGFPICRASVDYAGEGYNAAMAWVQVIRYGAENEGETVLVDTAPQLAEAGMPYYAWGPNPSFFDAPSMPKRGVAWMANTFLVKSPDALMSRVVEPLCGFAWGYTTRDEGPAELLPLTPAEPAAWAPTRAVLRERYPSWSFGPTWANES